MWNNTRFRVEILWIVILAATIAKPVAAQEAFYFGNDLSYANQMEDCGADFKEDGKVKDVYQIYADHGNNLVRLRLWIKPTWQRSIDQPDGVKEMYSDYDDVKEAIQRSKAAGMNVLLDFHYSDFWADPGRQILTQNWYFVGPREDALADSVYNYTHKVLSDLNEEGLLPEMIQVGNETNSGIMRHRSMNVNYEGVEFLSDSWSRHAKLFNAGISAARAVADSADTHIDIALHYAGVGSGLEWWYQNAVNNGITDFDVIGFSYYENYHGSTISGIGTQVVRLRNEYPDKKIMILETAYPWTSANFDGNPNIVSDGVTGYLPLNPANQLRYMVDLTNAVKNNGGDGVIFWESAWVSTGCSTAWSEGSSHDHVAFFRSDTYDFIPSGAGQWMEPYIYALDDPELVTFRVDMKSEEVSDGVYLVSDFDGDGEEEVSPMFDEGRNRYSITRYMEPGSNGEYYFMNGDEPGVRETIPVECASEGGSNRTYDTTGDIYSFEFEWASCTSISVIQPQDPEITVTFAVDMSGVNTSNGVYVTGDFTRVNGSDWSIMEMQNLTGNIYTYETKVDTGAEGGWYFLNRNDWGYRETVPSACVGYYNADRGYFLGASDTTFAYKWSSCETFDLTAVNIEEESGRTYKIKLDQNYPNPFNPATTITYEIEKPGYIDLSLFTVHGRKVMTLVSGFKAGGSYREVLNASELPSGVYLYRLKAGEAVLTRKLMLIK
ncbi:MAG TPA: hypothetical protein DEQ34_14465 [Balneolaceae bacterium]|nr:hypothetical protein [Balneolaceae bacterium]